MAESVTTYCVAPWGRAVGAEIELSRLRANKLQSVFTFDSVPNIPLDEARYALEPNGYHLDRAARGILRRKQYRALEPGQLILVTSLPYSEPGAWVKGEEDPLNQGFYFLDDSVESAGKQLAIISTYLWEQFRPDPMIPALHDLGGRRALEPYLLFTFAMIVLGRRLPDYPYHQVSRGCPFDYNHNVHDIDLFFRGGRFCEDCEKKISSEIRETPSFRNESDALRKLLDAAAGRPEVYKYKFALSFSGAQRKIAQELSSRLTSMGLSVFYDDQSAHDIAGRNLDRYFSAIFGRDAEFCIVLVSHEYVAGRWTSKEWEAIHQRAERESSNEFIIPILVDDANLPGLSTDVGWLPLTKYSMQEIADILSRKVRG